MALLAISTDSLISDLSVEPATPGVSIWWLGQAGFCVRYGDLRIAIDPYLSNSLARKYAGSKFPHRRMMPAPVAAEDLHMLDYVFCTHGHTDHMDGETLSAIAKASSTCRFVVPASEQIKALERGIPAERMLGVKAGDAVPLGQSASFFVVPAAHEERRQDEIGQDIFLGYVLKLGGRVVYHPGDCVPFDGQDEWLRPHKIDLGLMPVNGRDDNRRSNGVPGNFHLEEAVDLCKCSGIGSMLGHHYGMFEFNTIDPVAGQRALDSMLPNGEGALVRLGVRYVLE